MKLFTLTLTIVGSILLGGNALANDKMDRFEGVEISICDKVIRH